MNKCNETLDKFSAFLDDELTEIEKINFINHIDKCKKCSDELIEMESLLETINSIEQVPLPEGFHQTFMNRLKSEEGLKTDFEDTLNELPKIVKHEKTKSKKNNILKYNKTIYIAASFIIFLFIAITSLQFVGINIPQTTDQDKGNTITGYLADEQPQTNGINSNDKFSSRSLVETGEIKTDINVSTPTNDSIMYYNISVEVDDVNVALSKINALSGYNISSNFNNSIGNKNVTIERLIDFEEYNNTLDILKNIGKISNESERIEKIAYNLKELNAQLYAKKIEKSRLSSLIKNSKSINVIFTIDNRINLINQDINNLNNMILNYDKLSKNPNISIYVYEKSDVFDQSNKTLKEKTTNAFVSSINITTNIIQKTIIFLASYIIPFIILISFIYILFVTIVKCKKRMKFMCILFTFLLVGCSPRIPSETLNTESSYDMAATESPTNDEDTSILEAQKRKIIINGNLKTETYNFDSDISLINSLISENNSYIENSSLNIYKYNDKDYRIKSMTIKVPSENYESFKMQIQVIGKLIKHTESEEDVTAQYYDSQSNLELKLEEEKRLEELSASATEIEDIIAIEEKLSEVKSNIELYKSQLKSFDSQVQYSTLNLELKEVSDEQINVNFDNFGYKVVNGFKKSINYTIKLFEILIVFISFIFFPVVVLILFLIIVFSIVKFFKKKILKKPKVKK